jgi:thiol-disulfide isomerase/thioredoxin
MWSFAAIACLVCGGLAIILIGVFLWLYITAARVLRVDPVAQAHAQQPSAVPGVVTPLDEQAAIALLSTHQLSVLMVQKPQCGACVAAKPEFIAAAASCARAGNATRFYTVNGDLAPALRATHKVVAYPTFLGVDLQGNIHRFASPRTAKNFEDFVLKMSASAPVT